MTLSTNFIGYGLAGLTRRFLVYPSQAVWPTNLATMALIRAFHTESNNVVNGWAVSRMRWFMYCFTAMFIYFWFPGYIIQAMSYFNWITWISPKNVKLAAIAGSVTGLGLSPLPTLDWNQLVAISDPLINPFVVSVVSYPHDPTHLYAFLIQTTMNVRTHFSRLDGLVVADRLLSYSVCRPSSVLSSLSSSLLPSGLPTPGTLATSLSTPTARSTALAKNTTSP